MGKHFCRLRGPGRFFLGLSALVLLSSCQQLNDWLGIPDPWAGGYRDSSVNFISNLGFDKQDQAATVDTPALWTWAWKTSPASDAANYNYMTFDTSAANQGAASILGTIPSGLPSTLDPNAKAYLLELPNLLPAKDSDFESQTTATLTDWSLDPDTTSSSSWQVNSSTSGSALYVNLNNKIGVSLNLAAIGDSRFATSPHSYQVRLSVLGVLPYIFGNWGQTLPNADQLLYVQIGNALGTVKDETILKDLDFFQKPSLFFGSFFSTPSATIDNIRIIRKDLSSSLKLRLLLRPLDSALKLWGGGTYSFVVWVLVPPSRSFVTESTAANPYAASVVTLSMSPLVDPKIGFANESFSLGAGTKGTWQRLELKQVGINFQFDNSISVPVIELSIYPTDPGHPDPGGILVAQPELHFFL